MAMSTVLLEICVDDAEGLAAAIAGGADRIELCSALELDGLTPSPGLMAQAAQAPIPVYAMVRPRPGDFVFSARDEDVMLREIDAIRAAGLAGVVLGASRPGGALDQQVLARLSQHAAGLGLGLTLHRAFDLVPDFAEAIEIAVDLQFERILTSGGRPTALEGIEELIAIKAMAGQRISILPGAGITPDNVVRLVQETQVREVHDSCAVPAEIPDAKVVELGFAGPGLRRTDRQMVVEMKRALASL